MPAARLLLLSAAFASLAACSAPWTTIAAPAFDQGVVLRTLTETAAAAPARSSYTITGDLVPTPSHPGARYFVLWQRGALLTHSIIAILRQERGDRIAYARVEVDCAKRLFHVLGVGNRRSFAESSVAYDGPLRPIDKLPLRQEIASHVCRSNNTPLAPAPAA